MKMLFLTLLALASSTLAGSAPGAAHLHEKVMKAKYDSWTQKEATGVYDSRKYKELSYTPCVDGKAEAIKGNANNTFLCDNIDLYHFLPHSELGSKLGRGSSSWGWTSASGREFVAIGQKDGAAFAEITAQGKLSYLGRMPHNSHPSWWREIRGYQHYMMIGSEARSHGIQIFDMRKLLHLDPEHPKTFSNETDLTGLFRGLPLGRSHNVVVNEESGFAYAVGAMPWHGRCEAGLIFIDMSDPSKPVSPGCDPQDGYVHDAQCLVYRGPHKKYRGHEICYAYDLSTLTIFDVTNKANSKVLSRTWYKGSNDSFTHQGQVLNPEWQTHLLLDDEFDEIWQVGYGKDQRPATIILDISDLTAPKVTGHWKADRVGTDHNQYVWGNRTYQSNYGLGLHVIDVSSIPEDPTGKSIEKVGFFDMYPEDDHLEGGGLADFVGTWSSYAGFKSGYIFINSIERGGFVVKMTA